ncbi:response regulator [Cellulophaga sp. Hel_I_12]|uniref:response regulator n=1 Tax=Cellulophaga sp. Hel_I_12 TaxID=1249972 RepID=UPI00064609F4|nr:response regulator [Cellulophaga sp. Hel_I_12]
MEKTNYIIYLADDDEDDRQFFEEITEEMVENILLKTFENGIDLLKSLFQSDLKKPDFIFLDLNMPLMDGEECLSEIRAAASLKDIPIIIYSTSIDFSKAERFRDAGANLYLKKPNNYKALKAAILNCLEHFKTTGKNPEENDTFIVQL